MEESKSNILENPFRPGAGHTPPFLAGREDERAEFAKLLRQRVILENLELTGLRGLGKTVLLEAFKEQAIQEGWLWVGADISESISINEENLATRIITDLSMITSNMPVRCTKRKLIGFSSTTEGEHITLNYETLITLYKQTPGLTSDKVKKVLETVWEVLKTNNKRGVIFAYDEAQNFADHGERDQYPLSLLLDVFQSIQRKEIPFMLALTGLPTLPAKLVDARTYAERMFRVISLSQLSKAETKEAIVKPIEEQSSFSGLTEESINSIWDVSLGYPYFVQYVCKEAYDVWVQDVMNGQELSSVPIIGLIRKLDTDFFAGRWARPTDRQRELLSVIAQLPNSGSEFTVQDIASHATNKSLSKPFSNSHISQMLSTLSDAGLVFKNRHGKYSFAVPLLGDFIKRQLAEQERG